MNGRRAAVVEHAVQPPTAYFNLRWVPAWTWLTPLCLRLRMAAPPPSLTPFCLPYQRQRCASPAQFLHLLLRAPSPLTPPLPSPSLPHMPRSGSVASTTILLLLRYAHTRPHIVTGSTIGRETTQLRSRERFRGTTQQHERNPPSPPSFPPTKKNERGRGRGRGCGASCTRSVSPCACARSSRS